MLWHYKYKNMNRQIFNTSLSEDEFLKVESLFRKSKESGLTTDEVEFLEAASRKSFPPDLTDQAYLVYNMQVNEIQFQAIRIINKTQIQIHYPIVIDESVTLLKARLYSTQMTPTIKNGDIGYFRKVENPERFFLPGDIYLLQTHENNNWFCRLGQSEDPMKVRIYYDGSEVQQDVPFSHFKTFWQLKAINRQVSQSY